MIVTMIGFIDYEVAFDKIAGFEKSEDLAMFLIEQEVRGIPGSVHKCAISTWLHEQTGLDVLTNGEGIYVSGRLHETKRDLTPAMYDFIGDFDNTKYPALICAGYLE